jgi:hypothetical protein
LRTYALENKEEAGGIRLIHDEHHNLHSKLTKLNSVALVRERPALVGKVSVNVCG